MSNQDAPQVLKDVHDQSNHSLRVSLIDSLINVEYNELSLSYTGSDLSGVIYKLNSVVVATLTLGYTGGLLTSVVRS